MKHFASSATPGMHEGYTAALRAAAVQRNPTPTNVRFPAVNFPPMRGQAGKHVFHQVRRGLRHPARAA